ncbi:MAG: primosomal protein N' [Candidatus Cardinium sp.]|uniref:replication restart helicase PriA n=1 Tax=Cardinium endosymbiont of Dermatophagoides farinae TaxID=2597823 RepID=UPI00118350D7|nr:primosomal protein N' [Cardinium endosymbiont of Dermatophagoides farinae]TSJ80916.1 primosomal protein N' [Cardinium endosymbiont of Dermatophagoides farinae]UWW96931.1 MAG: primosomal protein N' [Candidatus Cardinium sp.]
MKKFADVLLPLPIKPLTYHIPSTYENMVDRGSMVLVSLRIGKLLLGMVMRCHCQAPTYPTKDLLGICYETPLFTPQQLALLEWIADYYLSNLGETLSLAWPKGFNLQNSIVFQINQTIHEHPTEPVASSLSKAICDVAIEFQKRAIIAALHQQPLSYKSILQLMEPKEASKALIALLSQRLVKAVPTTKIDLVANENPYFTLSPTIDLDALTTSHLAPRAPKQQALLAHFLANREKSIPYTSKKELLAYSKSAFNILCKKGILTRLNQLPPSIFTVPVAPLATLTPFQKNALAAIQTQFVQKRVVLLHGAIGSGKTELYMHLIASALQEQKQVLLLVPEIGLVTHIAARIRPFLGEWLVVHHSKQSHKERLQTWARLLHQTTLVVVGTRSALLLPFKRLQLIIVDEEHDPAYKQSHPMPTYHARDSSILLAQQHHAKVLLGSGTPAIESYYNAQSGKYGLVTLHHRFGAASRPKLFFIDLNIEEKRKAMRAHFSQTLLDKLQKNSIEGGQAMIFQNRRGYAQYFLCADCGWIPRCLTCAVSLTYHQEANQLRCHYCDYATLPFYSCNHCGSQQLHNIGFGTEKLEESLQLIFPEQKISRMDLDSTKGKNSYQSILEEVTAGSIDILVGTQMMAKGLDFPNIRLIGILDIDGLLYFPDFRSNEKCFQLITQLAGRAGRRNQQGSVFIQTRQTDHPLFQYLSNGDYEGMYQAELAERKRFAYPPYVRLIKLSLSSLDAATLQSGAMLLKNILAKKFRGMVLGPQQPLVGKIRNHFLLDLFLKLPHKNLHTLQHAKATLKSACTYALGKRSKIKIVLDIDPI